MDWITNKWMPWSEVVTEPSEESLVDELEHLGRDVLKGSWEYGDSFTSFLRCLYSVVKAEFNNSNLLNSRREVFKRFYRDVIPKIIGFQLSEQSWRWVHPQQLLQDRSRKSYYNDEGILLCLALLGDLSVVMLHSLQEPRADGADNDRVQNTVSIVRTFSEALDKNTLFQKHHEERDLPPFIQYNPHVFTKTYLRDIIPGPDESSGEQKLGLCVCLKLQNRTSTRQPYYYISCKCRNCEPPEAHRWITILLEYFGNNVVCGINGFRELVRVTESVKEPEKLQLEVVEVVLHLISKAVGFLKEEVACHFLGPCIDILRYVSQFGGHIPNTNSVGLTLLILKHLRLIFSCHFSPEVAERMIEEGRKRMQEQVLASLLSTMPPLSNQQTPQTPPPECCGKSQASSYQPPLFKFSAMRISETGMRRGLKKKWSDSPCPKQSDISTPQQPRKVQVCSPPTP